MGTFPLPLLRCRSFLLGESLSSLLVRLANVNHYNPRTILLDQIQSVVKEKNQSKDKLNFPYQAGTYDYISTITKLEVSKLYAATPHCFAQVITPPDSIIDYIKLPDGSPQPLLAPGMASKQLRPTQAAQFCPVCLKAAPYHRLIWTPLAVVACLEHKCLLLTSCRFCGKKISVYDIVATQCSTCEFNLTETEAQPLDGDGFGLFSQSLIQSWLVNNLTPQGSADLLPDQPPQLLYRIIDGLWQVIVTLGNSRWPYLHQVDGLPVELTSRQGKQTQTPYTNYCLYATACKGLVNWPHGFYEFLQAYKMQRKENQPIHGGPKIDLGNIYTQWLQDYWQHPAFAFVHKAFEEYFAANYWLSSPVARTKICRNDPGAAKAFSIISIAEAARIMGVTPRWIELLINAGHLASYTAADCSRINFVSKAEVLEQRLRWKESITRSEAASWLGVTEEMITNMVKVGLLHAEFRPSNGFPRWLFGKSAIVRLLEDLARHIRYFSEQEQIKRPLIDLAEASRLVFIVGLDAVSILQQVAAGKLRAYKMDEDTLSLGSLFFDSIDLRQCIEVVKAENGWISREEVAKLLGVKDNTLARWVKVGLLTPTVIHKHTQFFDRLAVNQFIAEHITSDGAAQILGISKLTVQTWTRIGRLAEACVSGPHIDEHHAYLFNKERLVRWRSERMTFGEAVNILGVSKATFHRWIDEGNVEPLDDMGGKQRWFSRQTILDLHEFAKHK